MNCNITDDYNADSIKHLETREAFRTRIPTYLGSEDIEGAYQSFKEIINNSTDEALAGYGDVIEITFDSKTNTISVRDYGRGVPFSTENGRNVLVEIYTESHTGGKFDKNAYKNSSGLNGLGGTAACMSSSYFKVVSIRDGKMATAIFKEGILQDYSEVDCKDKNVKTGTLVVLTPDKKVFKEMKEDYSFERIKKEIKNISFLNKGIKFVLTETQSKEQVTYYSKNGIADFIMDKVQKPLMKKPIIIIKGDGTDEVEIAFMWTGDPYQEYVFVNGLFCPNSGTPATGAKTAITNFIKKNSNKDISPELIRKGLVFAINCRVANPSFEGQVKSKINNASLRVLSGQAFKEGLEIFANTADFKTILDMIEKFAKAEKAAEKAREAVLSHNKEMKEIRKNKLAFIEKLSDAECLGQDAILCISEGDSAGSSIAMGRDTKKHGILRIKGKMLNCLKAEDDKIFKNEEIKLLLYALGIDINHYDSSKLRYGKIAICADQDSDGRHIALLIMANLYRLCPQFLKENRLYWLQSPLFIEYDNKNNLKSWYYTDEEFNKVRNQVTGTVKRVKGLGQLSEKDLKATMFSTTGGQKMDLIEYSEEGARQLERLMGIEIEPRKDYVFNEIDFSHYGEV